MLFHTLKFQNRLLFPMVRLKCLQCNVFNVFIDIEYFLSPFLSTFLNSWIVRQGKLKE